ncbi:hypothetical protein ACOTVP_11660 [Aliarcobacter butzleri]|uniref:hypothetical protein n=1 Tax=Aliarcobacter butzleri TaxID=28197 RepID=UPI0021B3F796|nr:hypothetical protein [Aliarcobacter butzleri]UXC30696.1 hypothetical protein N3114_12380 [Aliarcobacter butzleri]
MLRIDDIKIKYKINIISFTNMFLFIIITIVLYYAMNNIKNINEENYTMSRLSTTILSSIEQGLQVSNALRGIIISPD